MSARRRAWVPAHSGLWVQSAVFGGDSAFPKVQCASSIRSTATGRHHRNAQPSRTGSMATRTGTRRCCARSRVSSAERPGCGRQRSASDHNASSSRCLRPTTRSRCHRQGISRGFRRCGEFRCCAQRASRRATRSLRMTSRNNIVQSRTVARPKRFELLTPRFVV